MSMRCTDKTFLQLANLNITLLDAYGHEYGGKMAYGNWSGLLGEVDMRSTSKVTLKVSLSLAETSNFVLIAQSTKTSSIQCS